MVTYKKTQECAIENEMAALKRQLDQLAPRPACPPSLSYNMGRQNALSPGFNLYALASKLMNAYVSELPRRLGLERRIELRRRQLNALRLYPVFAAA